METAKALIRKYLQGKCNTEECVLVEKYIEKNPAIIDQLFSKKEWDSTDVSNPIENEDIIYDGITQNICRQQRIKKIIKTTCQLAAGILLFMTLGYTYKYFLNMGTVDNSVVSNNQVKSESLTANMYYINSDNKPMQILASDGSQITLYPKSEVRFVENFESTKERIVELKGKAKFDVAKDKTKPFRVISKGLVTSALGTVFIVDELAFNETGINLLEGSIEIKTNNTINKPIKRIIKPNESLNIDHQSAKILKEVKVDSSRQNRSCYYVQNNQKISIKNLAVEDVIHNIEQNFGVELNYDRTLLSNKYFSGTFKYSNTAYIQIIEEINYLHKTNIIKK